MRSAVIILSLVGAVAALLLGGSWVGEHRSALDELAPYRAVIELDEVLADGLHDLEARLRAGYALLAAGCLGLVGALLVAVNRPRWAGLALVVGGLAPVVFDAQSVIFTFMLILAGLLALRAQPGASVERSFWRAGSRRPHA